MKKKILFVLAAILLIGTGCSGADGPIGGPAGLTPETEEPESPGGSNPFFVSGGETDGDEAPAAATEPMPSPPKAQGTVKAPSITCFEKVLAEGGVGNPYSQNLEAAGGSGGFTYALSSGGLPAGLALAAALISAPETEGRWDAVYEVTVPDDVADIAWSWTGDTTNVCASTTKPDVTNADFRTKSPDGEDGGWDLHSAEVFVFRPGKFLNAPSPADGTTVYHGSFIYDVWLEDEGKLTTETHVLKEASPNVIGIGIGQHWEDG